MRLSFEVCLTYDCNSRCPMCCRFIDLLPWPDSYLTVEDVRQASRIVQSGGLRVELIKVSGGEPSVHPDCAEICRVLQREWGAKRVKFYGNGVREMQQLEMRTIYSRLPTKQHLPVMLSPADLGIKTDGGVRHPCTLQIRCGHGFDAFGFSPCATAAPLSRLLRTDVHRAEPVLKGSREMCRHCVYSLPRHRQVRLREAALRGEVEWPTRTYLEGVERQKSEPWLLKRFRERL